MGTLAGASGAVAAQSTPSPSPATTPKSVQLIPAFDHDLPVGKAQLPQPTTATAQGTVTPDADWVCSVYAPDPDFSGGEIHGQGSQSCSGAGYSPTKINVTIQAYMGLGLWNNRYKAVGAWSSAFFDQLDAWYSCVGDGTYTYRIVTDGWAAGGTSTDSVQSENYLRVSC